MNAFGAYVQKRNTIVALLVVATCGLCIGPIGKRSKCVHNYTRKPSLLEKNKSLQDIQVLITIKMSRFLSKQGRDKEIIWYVCYTNSLGLTIISL